MKRIWMMLLVIALLVICMAVPALAAQNHTCYIPETDTYYQTLGLAFTTPRDGVKNGDLIRLVADETQPVTIDKEVWLDLNGHDITGTVTITSAGKLYLIDSANNDYTDKNGGVIKTISFGSGASAQNNIARVFTTKTLQNKGLYDGNHRFLTVKTSSGYSAHRIYLAIKSTLLVSNYTYSFNTAPTIQFRSLLRCDQTVAGLIGTNYGVQPTYNGTRMVAKSYDTQVDYYHDGSDDNNKSAGLVDILKADSVVDGTVQSRAEANASARAWIELNDQFDGEKKITSAQSSDRSIKEMVELANEQTNLRNSQKKELGKMYDRWGASMASWGWNVDKVATYSTAVEKCLCGSETTTHKNGCDGTKLTWYEWDLDQKSYLPNEPGNWYLTADTISTKNGVNYVKLTGGCPAVTKDYYSDGLVNVPVYTCTNTVDGETYAQPMIYASVGQTAAPTTLTVQDLLQEQAIKIDVNGLKIEAHNNSRIFSGLNNTKSTFGTEEQIVEGKTVSADVTRAYYRQAKMDLTICDTSEQNTGTLVATGVYSKRANTQADQGELIWISDTTDALALHNITLDGSTLRMGYGCVMLTRSETHMYNCHVIGGTAQAWTTGKEQASNKNPENKVYVHTRGGSATGGGAIAVDNGAHLTIHGGTVENGTAIYQYMQASGVAYADRSRGGGNIYVTATSSLTLDGSVDPVVITGGKALTYGAANPNATAKYGVGGGVYLVDQAGFTVKGDVTIADNYTGTVTSAAVTANTGKANYIEPNTMETSELTPSNVYLPGTIMTAEQLTGEGKIGLTLHGYEAAFANADANYVNSGKFVADEEAGKDAIGVLKSGVLSLKNATITEYSVGYGIASIHPTDNDIRNGLILLGHNNQEWSTAKEYTRYTRYWHNTDPDAKGMEPTPAYNTVVGTWEELMATCIAITDTDGDTVLLIEADACSMNETNTAKVKSLVSMATGVPQNNITISASHQHSTPKIGTEYWTNEAGKHTNAVDLTPYDGKTTKEDGKTELRYANTIFAGELLDVHEPRVIRTDYAATFFTGVVKAAVAAMADRAAASVQYGILDTTIHGNQYNFVRNIAYVNSAGKIMGMNAVHHRSFRSTTGLTATYETDMDTTMQLVEFVREGTNNIIMANFQTHPHLAGGDQNLNINADMIGKFRVILKQLTGADVLYFSGAGGNVNASSSIDADPYVGQIDTTQPDWKQRQQRANIYGDSLARLANTYMTTGGSMTALGDDFSGDVQVRVSTYRYAIWDEETYLNEKYADLYAAHPELYMSEDGKTQLTVYGKLLERAKKMINWDTGGRKMTAGAFGDSDIKKDWDNNPATPETTHWSYFVNIDNIEDKKGYEIYSYYHASNIYARWKRKQENDMAGVIPITAYDLGGIGFVAAPYEMFQENGQQIKGNVHQVTGKTDYTQAAHFYDLGFVVAENPYPVTIIATCANGGYGYIPSVVGFENGGYSTDTTKYDRGTGEGLAKQYVDMLRDMRNPDAGFVELPEDDDPANGEE